MRLRELIEKRWRKIKPGFRRQSKFWRHCIWDEERGEIVCYKKFSVFEPGDVLFTVWGYVHPEIKGITLPPDFIPLSLLEGLK